MKSKRNIWYFGLEPLKARYTAQLSTEWMPATFEKYKGKVNFNSIEGNYDRSEEIKVGSVLDAVGRGKYAMSQCAKFLTHLNSGDVRDGDIVFLQDYWHPGIESILYALDLYKVNVKFYSMLHAQSVDEYDFTHAMKDWMRGFELGLDVKMDGIFVGSSIHKDQLRAAGFKAPIHVVSLPLHKELTLKKLPNYKNIKKENTVVYSSRLDKEKNPFFMMEVAKKFLDENPDWEWHVTTSGKEFKSTVPNVIHKMHELTKQQPRFKMLRRLSKEEYYTELAKAKIQFNSSLQDYVSWTVLESTLFGCDIIFPNFRSFPEFIPEDKMYKPFNLKSALYMLTQAIYNPTNNYIFPDISDIGRQLEAYIMINDVTEELNVWHELEYCKHLIKTEKV